MGCLPSENASTSPKGSVDKKDMVIKKKYFMNDYAIQSLIEKSTYGQVWNVKSLLTKEERVVLLFYKDLAQKLTQKKTDIRTEIEKLTKLDHPNIMRIFDIYEDESKYYIVVEKLLGLTLAHYLPEEYEKHLSEEIIATHFKSLLLAVNYLHLKNYIHGHITLNNLMFVDKENKNVKLTDLPFSQLFGTGDMKLMTSLGSPLYLAPEILLNNEFHPANDIWSCGILLYFILSGSLPYTSTIDGSAEALIEEIKSRTFDITHFTGKNWEGVSENAKGLLLQMLNKDFTKRPTAEELLQHPWFSSAGKSAISKEQSLELKKKLQVYRGETQFHKAILLYITSRANEMPDEAWLKSVFSQFDKNGNGFLTREELKEGLSKIGVVIADKEFEDLFVRMDKDKNDTISYSEFLSQVLNLENHVNEKRLAEAFSFFDKNSDDFIDRSEVVKAFKLGWISESEIAETMKEADKNKDAKISYKEFKGMIDTLKKK